MRAAGVTELGGPVRALDLPDPLGPTTDGVLIEVFAAGVANWDEIVRAGGWDVGASPPMALGVEVSGSRLSRSIVRWPVQDPGTVAPGHGKGGSFGQGDLGAPSER